MADQIPLHAAVAAIRKHQPTKDVVPEWLVLGNDSPNRSGSWNDARSVYRYKPMGDDAARLIVEACMWRTWNADEVYAVRWNKKVPGAVVAMDDGELHEFGPDLLAALMFACGVPVPTKETP